MPSGIGTYDAIPTDAGTIENHGVDADEAVITDRTAVQHGLVADRDTATDGERDAVIGVQHAAILYVGAFPDMDRIVVTAHDHVEPDTDVVFDDDAADDCGIVSDKPIVAADVDALVAK